MADPTIDDILGELSRLTASAKVDGGFTVAELKAATSRTEAALRNMIRAGIAEGLITVQREQRPAIDGSMRWVPVYKLVKKPGKVRAS